ncbi:MAG: hypothetical protein HFE85_00640 [Clostridiales bacterium]|nr:hypothetical protein [Clostridiales bacterium]
MLESLRRLMALARSDSEVKKRLLLTRQSDEPMDSFCQVACELGCAVTVGELLAAGEEYSCNQLKSTNGGGVNPYQMFDDPYEQFFVELEFGGK